MLCEEIHPGFFKGFGYALDETGYYFIATIKGIGEVFTGKAENVEVMGPVGIASEITSTKAWSDFFYLMSAISLSLGIFNLLPIYPLDGYNFLSAFTSYDNAYMQFMKRYGQYVLLVILLCFSWIISDMIGAVTFPMVKFWQLIVKG